MVVTQLNKIDADRAILSRSLRFKSRLLGIDVDLSTICKSLEIYVDELRELDRNCSELLKDVQEFSKKNAIVICNLFAFLQLSSVTNDIKLFRLKRHYPLDLNDRFN